MKIMKRYLMTFFFATLALMACGGSDDDPQLPSKEEAGTEDGKEDIIWSEWNDYADTSTSFLIENYWSGSSGYFVRDHIGTTYAGYWPQAHAMDVVIDGYIRNKELYKATKDQAYYTQVAEYSKLFSLWYTGIYKGNGNRYENNYFDDMEWIALTMIRLYEATGEKQYLDTAKKLWDAIKTAWDDKLGGGLYWRGYFNASEKQEKNACSNGPGSLVACRLWANDVDKDANLEWAKKIFEWEKQNLVNSDGRVLDNKKLDGYVTDWTFTYNQGTYLGAAHELFKMTGERQYLQDACLAANYTVDRMTDGGILKKEGSTNGDDAGLFRAVFIRYFVKLALEEKLDPTTSEKYRYFLLTNSNKLWSTAIATGKTPTYYWNRDWTKSGTPNGSNDAAYDMQCQTSGGTLIEARALYENEQSKK